MRDYVAPGLDLSRTREGIIVPTITEGLTAEVIAVTLDDPMPVLEVAVDASGDGWSLQGRVTAPYCADVLQYGCGA